MKKTLAVIIALAAIASTGCNKNKDAENQSVETSDILGDISFSEIGLDDDDFEAVVTPAASRIQVTENTFDWLADYDIQADDANTYMATFTCLNSSGLEEGIYSSPDVEIKADGNSPASSLAYMMVSDSGISVNVSFSGIYIQKDEEISVTIKNFNALNEPEEGEETVDYNDISDETVFEGTLSFATTASDDFGYIYYEFGEGSGISSISVGQTNATLENCRDMFSDSEVSAEDVVVKLSDGSEISFDSCYKALEYDEEGEVIGEYDLLFSFDDESEEIDLSEFVSISAKGKVLIDVTKTISYDGDGRIIIE